MLKVETKRKSVIFLIGYLIETSISVLDDLQAKE
jgi:hypothetical protein